VVSGCVIFIFALWGIGREVWVGKVVENMPAYADMPALLSFVMSAFAGTDLVVQVLSILAVTALGWLASELAHALRQPSSRFI